MVGVLGGLIWEGKGRGKNKNIQKMNAKNVGWDGMGDDDTST